MSDMPINIDRVVKYIINGRTHGKFKLNGFVGNLAVHSQVQNYIEKFKVSPEIIDDNMVTILQKVVDGLIKNHRQWCLDSDFRVITVAKSSNQERRSDPYIIVAKSIDFDFDRMRSNPVEVLSDIHYLDDDDLSVSDNSVQTNGTQQEVPDSNSKKVFPILGNASVQTSTTASDFRNAVRNVITDIRSETPSTDNSSQTESNTDFTSLANQFESEIFPFLARLVQKDDVPEDLKEPLLRIQWRLYNEISRLCIHQG